MGDEISHSQFENAEFEVFRERLASETALGFGDTSVDICFIEHLNGVTSLPLEVSDERGNEVASRYFTVKDGLLQTLRPLMPSMFTLDERVIRQDCLGYLMERYPLSNQ